MATKYRSVKTNGYASKKEAKRAAELKLLQRAGKIRRLREQVPFELIPKYGKERAIFYLADFVYDELCEPKGEPDVWRKDVVEDVKGYRTPVYRLKRRFLMWRYGVIIRET